MQKSYRIKFLALLIGAGFILSACVQPSQKDPFERLPEEETVTVSGEIFPFSVSVSTRATHRLEKDGKLVAYLASEVVNLAEFERAEVELEGVMRNEKMREILWVHGIKVPQEDAEYTEIDIDKLFETKQVAFVYPADWNYTQSPNGVAYFSEIGDPARRVFLTFSVEELSKEDKKNDPNVLISNLAGVKSISSDEIGRDREKIVLFSNLYDQKYTFVFTHNFEEFEKKKAFFRLLNSFVEGEESVVNARKEIQRKRAEIEAAKLEKKGDTEEEVVENVEEEEKEKESFLGKIFKKEEPKEEVIEEKAPPVEVAVPSDGTFKNLVDERAFPYESQYYRFKMLVPFGFWFQNFGPSDGAITSVGFADEAIESKDVIDYWLRIKSSDQVTKATESVSEGVVTIRFPHADGGKYFELTGSARFRDAMKSIQASVESF